MALQKFTVYVVASLRTWELGKLSIVDYDPTPYPDFQCALIGTHEIELDVPAFDVREQAIVVLEKEIEKERADSQVRINLLLERISNLRAIGHEVVE